MLRINEILDAVEELMKERFPNSDAHRNLTPKDFKRPAFMVEMGKQKLAYEINYISEGYYVLIKFTSSPDLPAELDRVLGITDGVIRSLITLRCD